MFLRIWRRSEVKDWLEGQHNFHIAGDSGYPLSRLLIVPFSTRESENDADKRLFNRKLSSLRTMCSENIYGILKRRWPILKDLRYPYEFARKIVLATMILHNISIMWDQLDDDDVDDLPPPAPVRDEVHLNFENERLR